jgi:hypothetical protein
MHPIYSGTWVQTQKEQQLARQRVTEENQLATAVLSKYAKEQRERGEIAELHARHDVLRECALHFLFYPNLAPSIGGEEPL